MPDGTVPAAKEESPPGSRALRIAVPVVLSFVALAAVVALWGWAHGGEVFVAGFTAIFAGTSVVFGPTVVPEIGLTTWQLVAIVAWVTIAETYVYAYNLDLLERVPKIGPWIARARRDARRTLRERPWIETMAATGVGLYVFLPLPASGTLGGALIGHVIGLAPFKSFVATSLGALAAAVAYALLGDGLQRLLDAADVGTPARIVGALLAIGIGLLIVRNLGRAGRRRTAGDSTDDPASHADGARVRE
jgi:uncharacterized membrane protein